ncbi:type II toxin-antitoxin system VapC family toxin [Candidatus Poribacteria bacterium]|nr:type II toxin-antitoxin system VapC family toxin [Candidatus Poribacteria bacterium]
MEQIRLTLDAHTLIWYLDEMLHYKLSKSAMQAITKAEENGIIYIPIIAILEVLRLIEKGKFSLSFNEFMLALEKSKLYQIIPLDTRLLNYMTITQGLDLHDRLIVATAIFTNSVLISKDKIIGQAIKDKGINLEVLWSDVL